MDSIQQEMHGFKRTLFYVYILYRPDGRPFYVGKGQGKRINAHESFAKMGHKARRYSIIRKIWREGGQVGKYKVFETYDESEAFAMECYLIASIGRGSLANETDGGEVGATGWTASAEQRSRLSAAMRGRELSPEWHANVQAAKVGKPRSEECKAKIRATLTGRKLPLEHVEAAAAGHRGQKRSEEAKRRINEGQRDKPRPNAQGELHHQAKLTTDQVREIRRLRSEGMSSRKLARQYGVTKGAIDGVVKRRTWKHLADE